MTELTWEQHEREFPPPVWARPPKRPVEGPFCTWRDVCKAHEFREQSDEQAYGIVKCGDEYFVVHDGDTEPVS